MIPNIQSLVKLRRELHQYPEVSGEEEETSRRIQSFLEKQDPTKIIEFQKHGLAAVYDSGEEGKTVLIRADLDALPIQDTNRTKHLSKVEGVSYKCGHDGHMAMVCGVAQWLAENPPEVGRVVLLFQPAEETGEGAQWILDDPKFEKIEPDFVFALHNLPRFPKHAIVYRHGTFTAAVISLIVKYRGKTAHAGQPDSGLNPSGAIARLLMASEEKTHNVPEDDNFQLVTPVYAELGKKAYGTSAGRGEVHFTLRAWTTKKMKALLKEMEQTAKELARNEGLFCSLKRVEEFISNVNGEEAIDVLLNAAREHEYETIEVDRPFRWGEDFGRLSSKYRGAMFGLGAGENTPDLHNPDYDFPDELIETGTGMFISILKQFNFPERRRK